MRLRFEYVLDLADFFLNDTCDFFAGALGLQIGVVRDLAGFFLGFSFQFVKRAYNVVCCAGFHWSLSLKTHSIRATDSRSDPL